MAEGPDFTLCLFYLSYINALIDFKSVLDTILLLELLWYSWKPEGEDGITCFK